MIAYVIVGGCSEVEILRRVLGPELCREVEFVAGGGVDGVTSMARTVVAVRRRPTAIVIDADSPEPEAERDKRQGMEELVGSVAGRVPFRVIVAVPAFEVVFFKAPDLLKRAYPDTFSPSVLELAQLSTRRAIERLNPGGKRGEFIERILHFLKDEDMEAMQTVDFIDELRQFLRRVQEEAGTTARAQA